jgi:hypothetical protein
MKKLVGVAIVLLALAPALAAQTVATFAGNWDGTFKMQRDDGTEGDPKPVVFNLTQKGKVLTGTAGPPDRQWTVERAPSMPARPRSRSSSPTARCSSSP